MNKRNTIQESKFSNEMKTINIIVCTAIVRCIRQGQHTKLSDIRLAIVQRIYRKKYEKLSINQSGDTMH